MGDENRKSGNGDDFSDYFAEDDFFGDEPVAKPEREAQGGSEPEPEPEPESRSEPEPKPKSESKANPKPGAKPNAKPSAKPRPKPKTESKSEPARPVSTGGAPAIVRFGIPIALFVLISIGAIFYSKPSGDALLTEATQSFSKINSGVFDFAINITPKGDESAQPASISLAGPFELQKGKKLPVARIEYTVSSGGQEQSQTLIFTGDKAYFEIQGQAYELPPEAVKQLQQSTKDLLTSNAKSGGGGLAGVKLNFEDWLSDPVVSNGGKVGGQKTWQVDAKVDVVKAITDLVAQSKALGSITGSQLPAEISKADAEALRKAIKRSFVRVNVGRYDGLLRRFDLSMDVTATPTDSKSNSAAAAALAGGAVNVVIGIDNPNQPIVVEDPPNALPYSALQSLTGGGGATDQTGK